METRNWRLYYLKRRFAIYPRAATDAGFSAPEFLHEYYRKIRDRRSPPRRIADWLIEKGFRLWLPIRARQISRKFGLGGAWRSKALGIAQARFADPKEVALFRCDDAASFGRYMRKHEHSQINQAINPLNWRPDCVLRHKDRFYDLCAEHGLPTPRTLAHCSGGVVTASAPPKGPFCVKPVYGTGGVGFTYFGDAPAFDDLDAFSAYVAERVGVDVDWIAQNFVTNHADVAPIAMNALATQRVSTMLNEDGVPEIVTSVLRFACRSDARVDNISAGGAMAPIDPETGVLGRGCYGKRPGDFDAHPTSGAPIKGRTLPDWEATKALVLDAHARMLPEFNLIGWDIAPTQAGPVVIEANGMPCSTIAQRAPGVGAGDQRYGALIAWHLAKS